MRFSRTRIIQGAQARTQRHYKAQYNCTFYTFPLPIKVQKVVSVSKPKVEYIMLLWKETWLLNLIGLWIWNQKEWVQHSQPCSVYNWVLVGHSLATAYLYHLQACSVIFRPWRSLWDNIILCNLWEWCAGRRHLMVSSCSFPEQILVWEAFDGGEWPG